MADQSENPYSPPNQNGGRLSVRQAVQAMPITCRIVAAIASAVVFLFAFAGRMVWTFRDSYSIPDHPMFNVVFSSTAVLMIVAAYWMFFATIGHKLVSSTANIWLLGFSTLLTVPACVSVLWFFV